MNATIKNRADTVKPSFVREYNIEGITYLVTATEKPGANEDAADKVRRLIRREIIGKP